MSVMAGEPLIFTLRRRDNTIDVMDWAVAIRASSDLSISFSAISGNRER